ncbi:UNVERIFIED_CONTAM: UDP-glycosyltransferase 86A2 [Sesamum radiatum]|uniref:UDP-glycosyltransferase 86A2 n=1 Tax=Sesamum radiatum TaxID=300843 RepID=A0AAW2KUT5_SESRA
MAERLKLHAIVIPFPYQGHINPTINLALKLASKGLEVTFVHLEFVHHTLSKSHHEKTTDEVDLFSEVRQSGLDIRYATISDGFPWNTTDTLYSWPATIAEKYNLVNVSFRTETALVFSLIYHSELLRQNGHFPCKGSHELKAHNIEEEINYIPGVESINTRDFMPYLKEAHVTDMVHKVVFTAFKEVNKADFILHNTVQELESKTLSALDKYHRNYAIGPVNISKNLTTNSTMMSKSLLPESDCTQWLDSKSPGSVLYVSFGSLVQISKQVFEEIAYGLLLSEVNFIWVVRPGIVASDDANGLPAGFEDAVQDRGLVVPWCNQVMVLSNPAVGGFLTLRVEFCIGEHLVWYSNDLSSDKE